MIIIVLGMHKSGTTLISQTLHTSGIDMGQFDEDISYDAGNQYERHESQALNMAMLKCDYTHSLDVIHPLNKLPHGSDLEVKIIELIAKLNVAHQNWGFKDPRTCLTYPIWRSFLPAHKIIYVYRSPIEVWRHYRKNIPRYKIFNKIWQGYKALRAWQIYNGQLLKFSKLFAEEGFFVNFSKFMNEPASIADLQKYLNLPLTDCRDQGLYRSKPMDDIFYRFYANLLSMYRKPHVKVLYMELEQTRKALTKGESKNQSVEFILK